MLSGRMPTGAVLIASCALLPGCWDGQGRITPQSMCEFWARLDRGVRSNLMLAPEPATGLAPDEPAVPRPAARAADAHPHGTLYASRRGSYVLADVNLYDVPDGVRMVATGLRLADGTPVAPRTILLLPDATRYRKEVPRVDFGFEGRRPSAASPADRGLCLRVTYELDGPAPSVDGGSFALVLGQPDGEAGCRLGITAGVSLRDGAPMLVECIRMPRPVEPWGPSLPGGPPAEAPTVTFHLAEAAAQPATDTLVWIVPTVAPSGDLAQRRAVLAAGKVVD